MRWRHCNVGPNDGRVPDGASIARHWDGVHLTLWAYLTATQVRVESEAGWSMAWSWEGEQTCWLNHAFIDVEPMPPLRPEPWRYQDERYFSSLQRPGERPRQMQFEIARGERRWWS